jgi:hypothetical protein
MGTRNSAAKQKRLEVLAAKNGKSISIYGSYWIGGVKIRKRKDAIALKMDDVCHVGGKEKSGETKI